MLVTGFLLALTAYAVWTILERRAAAMLVVAHEMLEDGEYERSLEQLRLLSVQYGWTAAAREAEALRVEVRKRIVAAREEAESRLQLEQAQQQWRQQMEREAEQQRLMEEHRLRMEQSRIPIPTPHRRRR